MSSPPTDPVVQAYIELHSALKERGVTEVLYRSRPGVSFRRDTGPFPAAELITSIVEIIIPFTEPATALAVLYGVRPMILKWIDARAGGAVTVETQVNGNKHSISVRGNDDVDKVAKALTKLIDHTE
jgi:hypothetical protein